MMKAKQVAISRPAEIKLLNAKTSPLASQSKAEFLVVDRSVACSSSQNQVTPRIHLGMTKTMPNVIQPRVRPFEWQCKIGDLHA